MTLPRRRYRKSSWAVGLLVLAGLTWTLWTLLAPAQSREGARASVPEAASPPEQITVQEPQVSEPAAPAPSVVRRIEGVVHDPDGAPTAGVTVVVYQAKTAAPEWQRERLAPSAITGLDGTFRFGLPARHGLLIGFEHPVHAGSVIEVPEVYDRLELNLRPAFKLSGIVRDNRGVPLGGVRVAAESALDQSRRVEVQTTTANGRYSFEKLPAGLVRLVARHPRWQAVGEAVLVGETLNFSHRFTTLAAAPWRGRVVTVGQVPIANAVLELLPTNRRLGLVDPITTRSSQDGAFILAGLSRGPMSLLVRHPDHGTLKRTISVGTSAGETVLELPPRSRVSGRVSTAGVGDDRGAGVADLALQVTDVAGEIYHSQTDADGKFEFERPMSPGRATVLIQGGGYAFSRSQSFEVSVQVEEEPQTNWPLIVTSPTRVLGRCVDGDSKPLAGVTVFGTKQITASRLIGSDLASFIGTFGQEVALTLGNERDSLLAVTGEDGAFEFTAQAPGPLLLRYELANHAKRRIRVVVPAAGSFGQLEDIVMPRSCRISGTVLRGRRSLAGATVSVVGTESQTTVVTRGGGRFEVGDLMAGSYRVRARLPSMPTGHAEETVVVALDQAVPDLVLELPSGRTVKGIVTGRDGQPVANALVAVRGAIGQPTVTDSRGHFSLELPARMIELEVSLNDKSHRLVEFVGPQQNNLAIQIDAPPTGTLVVSVAGLPGRTRVPAVLLGIKRIQGSIPGEDRPRWVEVQNGELRWPLCPVGDCRVEIRCEGYAPFVTHHEFMANKEHNLGEILLEPGARVHGIVLDMAGNPVPNARVFVGKEADLDIFEPQVVSAADGTFQVRGVSTRSSSLVAYAAGFSPSVRLLSLPGDVLGGRALKLKLEPGSVILVTVENSPDSGLVQLWRGGRLLASAVLDDAGHAEFVDRGVGEYTVRLYGGTVAPQSVEVEQPGQAVRVVLD